MRNRPKAVFLLAFVIPVSSCSRGTKYQFPLVQKYTTQAGDVFYFRPRDGQFVLVERSRALAVAIAPEPNIEAFSYDDRITVSRPLEQGEMLENKTFLENVGAQTQLAMTADGRLLAGGDTSGVVNIWSVADGSTLLRLKNASAVRSLAFSPDGNFLAIGLAKPVGEPSDTVWLYDIHGNSTYRSFGSSSAITIAWSSDSRQYAAGLDDGSVLLAEATGYSEPHRIAVSSSPVVALAFHPSGQFLASAHSDKRILIHKLPMAELIFTFEPALPANPLFPRGFEAVAFDGTGSRFAADYADGDMRIWDASTLAQSLAK